MLPTKVTNRSMGLCLLFSGREWGAQWSAVLLSPATACWAQMLLLCWHFNESGEVEVERDGLDDFG